MPVTELFQWVGQNRRRGMLSVISGRSSVRFWFKDGRITGCASNDPPAMLGQFPLSRGKISERMLEAALAEQERRPRNLGAILVELGALAESELDRYVAAKAEETIYKLFEWDDADFMFRTESKRDTNMISVDLSVDDVLLRGAQRSDELLRMKEVFDDPGLMLCHTDHELNPETAGTPMARRLYELVDGQRTFGQILLASRASEFLATRFLYQLYKRGIITIRDVHEVAPDAGTPERACDVAIKLLNKGEHDAALETLLTCQSSHPRHEMLERTMTKIREPGLELAAEDRGDVRQPDTVHAVANLFDALLLDLRREHVPRGSHPASELLGPLAVAGAHVGDAHPGPELQRRSDLGDLRGAQPGGTAGQQQAKGGERAQGPHGSKTRDPYRRGFRYWPTLPAARGERS
jgi:hypothetical protein